MQIAPVSTTNQNNYKPNFGHTFRVRIFVKDPKTGCYDYVDPVIRKNLYKKLNAKVVGWLNEDFITSLRESVNRPRKVIKNRSANETAMQKALSRTLLAIDSDYKDLNMVRSVYNRNGLAYIATGIDVPVIENFQGARHIGMAKSDMSKNQELKKTPYLRNILNDFHNNSLAYVRNKFRLLRDKFGKEIILDLNFDAPTVTKGGKEIYELNDFNFYSIKKSIPLTEKEVAKNNDFKCRIFGEVEQTIQRKIDQIIYG